MKLNGKNSMKLVEIKNNIGMANQEQIKIKNINSKILQFIFLKINKTQIVLEIIVNSKMGKQK